MIIPKVLRGSLAHVIVGSNPDTDAHEIVELSKHPIGAIISIFAPTGIIFVLLKVNV